MRNVESESGAANNQSDCPPEVVGAARVEIPLLPDLNFSPDPELEAQGWVRRFMADPTQVKEATQLYAELGYEIRTEPVRPTELSELCGSCRLATCHAYVTIYTRKKPT